MDLGKMIRNQVRDALEKAQKAGGGRVTSSSSINVASATNVNSDGHTTSVYSDDEVTIIQRDGETRVIRHDEKDDQGEGDDR